MRRRRLCNAMTESVALRRGDSYRSVNFRLVLIMMACVTILTGLLFRFAMPTGPADPDMDYGRHPSDASVVHIVAPQETLWQIAKMYHPDKDPRLVIYYVRQINGLGGPTGPMLRVGQRIQIPIKF
ncbi:LysM peptidoglycan-binding domain-containing protein [Acetomicrobium sp. S15 = DSM 107314]|uniref:LysM peptidoglycan-binding domain-containing protein n=1 Tax=Acetomicrobium sp. S15 = DSM 107314 TaxID=2529858 RepID=UPI0018E1971D|nr:LysM domain-containing protein [Acetomicrobium sp. S15 = DSM 107314]